VCASQGSYYYTLPISFYFCNHFLSYAYAFPYLFQLGSMPTPSPTTTSSGGGGGPSSAAVSSATPSTQAASPHEVWTTDVTSGAPEV
jgi:hypothetical protein